MSMQDLFESTFGKEERKIEKPKVSKAETKGDEINLYEREKASADDIQKRMKDEFGLDSYKAKILVVGCGGMGSNVVSKLSTLGIDGATTVAVNTDAAHLVMTRADKKILIGRDLTKGLGAGGTPEIGRRAAEESKNELKELLKDANLVFLIAGLGGGTGTGCAPVIAKLAKEQGSLVVATGTLPFKIEGARIAKAEDGLYQLRQACDTAIVIENQRLLEFGGSLPLQKAFELGDEVISKMVKGISETISQPSLVNLDYADVKTIMQSGGVSTIGIGVSDSSNRAKEVVQRALKHPLLQVDYAGASGALIQVIGGPDMTLEEVNEIGEEVAKHLSPEAQTIWGARILDEFEGKIQVITIVTGVKSPFILGPVTKSKESETQAEVSHNLGIEVFR